MGPGKKVTDDALKRVKPDVKSQAQRLKDLGSEVDSVYTKTQPVKKK